MARDGKTSIDAPHMVAAAPVYPCAPWALTPKEPERPHRPKQHVPISSTEIGTSILLSLRPSPVHSFPVSLSIPSLCLVPLCLSLPDLPFCLLPTAFCPFCPLPTPSSSESHRILPVHPSPGHSLQISNTSVCRHCVRIQRHSHQKTTHW